MNFKEDFTSMKVTIMGLGLHGGGLASALFFLNQNAQVTITDLRDKSVLEPVIDKLKDYEVRYVLGEHRKEDFTGADIVIKNPAVPSGSPFLKLAKRIETDISVFLKYNKRPLIAVTGSKGKSTTVSALFSVFKNVMPDTKLGGNITTSPLTFLDECINSSKAPVILELSSWQLADIGNSQSLVPEISVITNIMPDHQNRYSSMEEYIDDKKLIYRNQDKDGIFICNYDDKYGSIFAKETKAKSLYISDQELPDKFEGAFLKDNIGFVRINGKEQLILPENLKIRGAHNKKNLLFAALILYVSEVDPNQIIEGLGNFEGIAHRMELVTEINKVQWFNDSASTIPQATAAASKGAKQPFRLIAGGTDKKLDFTGTIESFSLAEAIYLLEGTATDRLIILLKEKGIPFNGPYNNLERVVEQVFSDSKPGESVIFSPGATSFGMFLNEFDRGDQFRKMVRNLKTRQFSSDS